MGFLDSLKEIFAGFQDNLKKTYYFFEDKWYTALDKIDSKVPIYKVIDPIDKVIPSFVLFLLLILFLLILTGYLIQFSSPYEVSFLVSDSDTKLGISGVKLSGSINDSIFEKATDSKGEAKVIAQGLTRNSYGAIWQLLTSEKDTISAIINANKTGYKSITRKPLELTSKQTKILLEKEAINLDANYPNSTRVTLVDQDTGMTIVDSENRSYIKFTCNNKTTNPRPKTVTDSADGEIDGVFVLNETKCAFVINEAYANEYETKSGLSFALPIDEDEHTVTLTRAALPTTGTAKVYVAEAASSPEKRIPGIEVTLSDASGYATKDFTDNSGVAEFYNMNAGEYTITAISPDGNYYALTADAELSITIPVNDMNEVLIKMVKLNPELVRISNVKFVEDEDNNTAISGVKMFLQYVVVDKNGNKSANGEIGACKNSCTSDVNGIVKITGLDSNKTGRLVATAYKEGYVVEVFEPQLFKVGLGPEIVYLKKATPSNTGEAKVFVKSKSTQKPLNGARTSLYTNSITLSIKKIKLFDTPKVTDVNGRTDYNYLPMGVYYANAVFAGKTSPDSNSAAIDVGEGVHQIITLNVLMDTNISTVKLSLFNGLTREKITSPVNPQIKMYEVIDNNFAPTALLETLPFSQTTSSFTSAGYEPQKKLLLAIDINGYASNFVTINSLSPGENIYNVLMYPLDALDSNINIFFNGLYEQSNDIDSLSQATFIDKNHPAYYAKVDIVLTRQINEGELLSMLRIDGPMYSEGIPTKTGYAYNTSESFSCLPQAKLSGINDNNYYFPTQNTCTTGTKIQSAIKWSPVLRVGTYSYVIKLRFDENAADNDLVSLKFRAKENLTNYSSETPLKEKSFYISRPFCDSTDPTCPKIFFEIKINNSTLNVANGLDYISSEKAFKSTRTIPLASKQINQVEVFLYNNSGSTITPTLKLHSYGGFYWLGFNGTASGNIHMGDNNLAPKTISHTLPAVIDKTRSLTKNQIIFPDSYNTTQFLILEAEFGTEKYYTYISTKALGSALKIDADFIAGILNQNFDGQALNSSDNSPVDLIKATYTAKRDCGAPAEAVAVSPNGTLLQNQDLSVFDSSNYFEGIIPGIYAYRKDCIEVKVSPTNTNFDETVKRIYAGVGGAIDPALACIEIKGPQNISEDFTLEWNTSTKINITNKCNKPVKILLESDLIITPSIEQTLDTGRTQDYTITAKNSTYSPTAKFSDVLGVFPVIVKAKPESARNRKYAIADVMRVHVTNQNECFVISKDLFDFTSPTNDNSFTINNACQYTLIEDYYVPKAVVNSFGADLNLYKNKRYGAVDFNWDITMTGVTYNTTYSTQTIASRGNVYSTSIDPTKYVELGEHRKYYDLRIDMSKDNVDTNEFWIKWNDLYNDLNLFGASIDGNVIITTKNNQVYQIDTKVDYNIDERSCECNGISNGQPACNLPTPKNYCVSGMEQDPVFEGYAYTNIHFTLPEKLKVKYFDFNLITGKETENLSYYVTPFGTKDLSVLNITVTDVEDTKIIVSGDFRIYPQEGLTYILQDLGYDDTVVELTQRERFCIEQQANKAKLIDGNIYWVEPSILNYFDAQALCSNSETNSLQREGTIADSNKLLLPPNNYDSNWIQKDYFLWTSNCREVSTGPSSDTLVCNTYQKTNTSFKLVEKDWTDLALPMCSSVATEGTYDTAENCAQIVTCTSSPNNKVCALNNYDARNSFKDTGFYNLINPSVKVETKNVRSSGNNLPNGSIIVWVEGRFLKARFFGEDNSEYNSGIIPMKLEKTFATGTQYSIINIKDYVNSGKTQVQ